MRVNLFAYKLPPELIAQHPLAERSASRMLVLVRDTGEIQHRRFRDLPEHLHAGDCLVLNDTKVIPARLLGRRDSGGQVELLLLRPAGDNCWETLARPARRLRVGEVVNFDGLLTATVREERAEGIRIVRLEYEGDLLEVLKQVGRTPLPPYIHRDRQPPGELSPSQAAQEAEDCKRYQTVYADKPGAIAAPTAGLHFNDTMLEQLRSHRVQIAKITLHVGLGTFRPVQTELVEDHQMDAETYEISPDNAAAINACGAAGGRVVAVGTTVMRTLETAITEAGQLSPGRGDTKLFIYPGYKFRVVDALLTNFHLPRSTLLMLVSAFAGRERVLEAYRQAVERQYRFYSYGDCMLIV